MTFSVVCAWSDLGDPHRRASHAWTRSYWRHHFPDAELVEAAPDPFTRASGLNAAVQLASRDVILQADPDTVVPVEQAREAVRLAEEANGLVVTYSEYLYLSEEATKRLHAHRLSSLPNFGAEDCEFSGEGGAGPVTAFSRRTWELARGYDERFGLWGGDDAAFAFACEAFAGPGRRVVGPAVHSWHPRLPESVPGTPEYAAGFALLAEYRDAEARGLDAVRALVEARGA